MESSINFKELFRLKLLVKDIKIRYEVNISVYELDILNFDSFEDIINSLSCLPEIALCSVGLLGKQKDNETNILSSLLSMKTNYVGPSCYLVKLQIALKKEVLGQLLGYHQLLEIEANVKLYLWISKVRIFSLFIWS